MAKRITDKQRLDWLQKNKPYAMFYVSHWNEWFIRNPDCSDNHPKRTVRKAIDAEIIRSRKERGQ